MPDTYTQLLEWRRLEAAARGLSKIPHDFYVQVRTYLAEVRTTFERELRENPSGKKGDLARQTYQRASQVSRDIVEARMNKILSAAFQATLGGSRELPNALPEERAFFDSLLTLLRQYRQSVAPFLEPVVAPAEGSPASATRPSPAAPPTPRPTTGSAGAAAAPVFVRIVKEGRPVEAGGETLDLRKEDVLSLPPEVAEILIQGRIGERVAAEAPPLRSA
jgi:DNA replication initiation complex subunit (GINS family)